MNSKVKTQHIQDVIQRYANNTDTSWRTSAQVVRDVLKAIDQCLATGSDLTLTKYGRFYHITLKEQTYHTPNNHQLVTTPARQVIRFSESANHNQQM